MKNKLKAISAELKKASKTHAGQAAKIDKLIKPKMSKLHKSTRKSIRPKMVMKPMMSMKKPKATDVSPDMAPGSDGTGSSGMGKAAGILGLVGSAVGIAQGIKGLKGGKKAKRKKDKIPVAGRVQKPALSKKKSMVKKKEVFERQEYPIKSGRFKGLDEAEYKAKIRKLRKMKAERDASLKKPKLSKKKVARKNKAIASKTQAIKNAFEMAKKGKVSKKRAVKDILRKSKAINRKLSKIK